MSKKASPPAEGAPPKPSKLKTIGSCVGFIAIGAVVGPKFLGGGAAPAAPATGAEATTTTEAEGPLVTLDPITLNLTDGHLLQVGLALELGPDVVLGEGHGGDEDDPTKGFAKALDTTIEVLGSRSMSELQAAGGRESAKAELEEALAEVTHGEVVGVYFHQLVMQ